MHRASNIIQPDLTESTPWYLTAWGIRNNEATSVDTDLTGWSAWLIDTARCDSGLIFEVSTRGDPVPLLATGSEGIGNFTDVFGPGFSYWHEAGVTPSDSIAYNAYPGPGGEIGRRKGLKIPRGQPLAGSSPAPGTIDFEVAVGNRWQHRAGHRPRALRQGWFRARRRRRLVAQASQQ